MNRVSWRDAGLLAVCLGVLAAILHAGLSPYDFFVPNRVSWSEDASGLRFDRQGIAATSESIDAFASGRAAPVSIEAWLRRGASTPADGGVVFALGDGEGMVPLLLAQWKSSLYVRFPVLRGGALKEKTLSLKDDFPAAESRFVAFTSGAAGSHVYVDAVPVGIPQRSQPIVPGGTSLRGRLVLGSRLQACRGWVGRIDGLALYDRALSPEEIAVHAARVGQGGVRSLSGEPGLFALYAFDEGSGKRVRDLVGGAGDLLIPARYRPLDPGLLQLHPTVAGRPVSAADAIANLGGFVPVGLLLVWVLRRWTALRRPSLFWIATCLGFSLSLTIETIQAVLPSRVSAAADLALNSAGSALGALLAVATVRAQRGDRRRARSVGGSRDG
jgi:VanZ family protein